jgi:hypothetical protein
VKTGHGIEVSFSAVDAHRSDVVLRRLRGVHEHDGRDCADRHPVEGAGQGGGAPRHASRHPLVLLTTDAPVTGSAGDQALRALADDGRPDGFGAVFDVIEMESATTPGRRLRHYASPRARP